MLLTISRVLVLHSVEKHLYLELDQVKLVLVTVDSDFEIFLTEDVRCDLSHVHDSIVEER